MAPTEGPLVTHFKGASQAEYAQRWNKCWETKDTPWDRGGPSLALYDLLRTNPRGVLDPMPKDGVRKRALVPGCGMGHDVLLLATFGYDVTGLDISPKSLEEAMKHALDTNTTGRLVPENGHQVGAIDWLCKDFFETNWDGANQHFDLIFDYTFFCALHPSMRAAWASVMKSLLNPGGRLVCLEFPTDKPHNAPGPPWPSNPTEYQAYLMFPGTEPLRDEQGKIPLSYVHQSAAASFMRMYHWKPERTHAAGTKDGRVQDFISVWAHGDEPYDPAKFPVLSFDEY
ncbi:S-adenosyl-L-methionine-dependent methyltransferase [Xylariaceae sp. FL1272]|nr:S-adenosyl-L-methionine-dependent methyltransferase [Xylariaceae sp. FL1272]